MPAPTCASAAAGPMGWACRCRRNTVRAACPWPFSASQCPSASDCSGVERLLRLSRRQREIGTRRVRHVAGARGLRDERGRRGHGSGCGPKFRRRGLHLASRQHPRHDDTGHEASDVGTVRDATATVAASHQHRQDVVHEEVEAEHNPRGNLHDPDEEREEEQQHPHDVAAGTR